MTDAVSAAALVIALLVGVWQRHVMVELRAIRKQLERMTPKNGGPHG